MLSSNKRPALLALVLATLLLAGCTPPEANRQREGGPGADIGNRGDRVQMHGERPPVLRIYYETPQMGQAIDRSR
jgi:hypothetical protein